MEEQQRDAPKLAPSLASAIRRARIEGAERSDVVAELRGAEIARLEILRDALGPVLAQIPAGADLFDTGIVPGERPRLFIDMIGFVEMAHDRRTYKFIQDTRHCRVVMAETERLETAVQAVTDYIARRLVEREKAMASDMTIEQAARAFSDAKAMPALTPANDVAPPTQAAALDAVAALPPRARRGWFATALLFTIEALGSVVLFALLTAAFYFAWKAGEAWWVANYAKI